MSTLEERKLKKLQPWGESTFAPSELSLISWLYENGGEMEWDGKSSPSLLEVLSERFNRTSGWGSLAVKKGVGLGMVEIATAHHSGKYPLITKIKLIPGKWETYETMIVAYLEWLVKYPPEKWKKTPPKPKVGSPEWWAERQVPPKDWDSAAAVNPTRAISATDEVGAGDEAEPVEPVIVPMIQSDELAKKVNHGEVNLLTALLHDAEEEIKELKEVILTLLMEHPDRLIDLLKKG